MGKFYFMVFWTLAATAMMIATWGEDQNSARLMLFAFIAIGLMLTWWTWRQARRWRTFRTEIIGGVTFYVWIEMDGSEQRSQSDPRDDWMAEEADADGDGDGGGGD